MSTSLIGKTVGNFIVDELLAQGGMGKVYKARNVHTDVTVVIKIPKNKMDETGRARFLREAQIAQEIRHPGIGQVMDVGMYEGILYIVMEYLEGESLLEVIKSGQVYTTQEALKMLEELLPALDALHVKKITHRDIKPGNIFRCSADGSHKIIDFGLAKAEERFNEEVTQAGTTVGSPMYMAPEQALGHKTREMMRADIYAMGLVLYTMLTGLEPVTGLANPKNAWEVMKVHVDAMKEHLLTSIDTLPEGIQAVITRASMKNPANRYASGEKFLEDARKQWPTSGEAELVASTPKTISPPDKVGQHPTQHELPKQEETEEVKGPSKGAKVLMWAFGIVVTLVAIAAVVIVWFIMDKINSPPLTPTAVQTTPGSPPNPSSTTAITNGVDDGTNTSATLVEDPAMDKPGLAPTPDASADAVPNTQATSAATPGTTTGVKPTQSASNPKNDRPDKPKSFPKKAAKKIKSSTEGRDKKNSEKSKDTTPKHKTLGEDMPKHKTLGED